MTLAIIILLAGYTTCYLIYKHCQEAIDADYSEVKDYVRNTTKFLEVIANARDNYTEAELEEVYRELDEEAKEEGYDSYFEKIKEKYNS